MTTGAGSNTYSYDNNGSQTTRVIGADTYLLAYDAENHLGSVSTGGMGMNPTSPALAPLVVLTDQGPMAHSQTPQNSAGQNHFASYLLPAPVEQSSDLIFADGFENGSFSAWTSNVSNSGNLSVSPGAALYGSYGLQAQVTSTTTMYVRDDSPNAEPRYRARFYFDPNSIVMATGDYAYILQGYAASSTNSVLRIEFKRTSGVYQVRARALDNSAVWQNTAYVTLTDAPHALEVDWAAASAAGANDGHLTFWVDGVQQGNLTGLANDTYRMESVRLGVPYRNQRLYL